MTIQRLQQVKGLRRPMFDGRDVFSTVVTSTRKRMIFIAGQLAIDADGNTVGKGDMRAQMRQVGENLMAALAAAGATLDDLVQTSTFVTDWVAFREAIDVRHEYLGKTLPTSTTVQVSALANPDLMIEISAIAMIDA
jgi:enamine deaminase RidA (YjgF/YER057c/UK114 family)